MLSFLAETPGEFVRRRHRVLQAAGWANAVICPQWAAKVSRWHAARKSINPGILPISLRSNGTTTPSSCLSAAELRLVRRKQLWFLPIWHIRWDRGWLPIGSRLDTGYGLKHRTVFERFISPEQDLASSPRRRSTQIQKVGGLDAPPARVLARAGATDEVLCLAVRGDADAS